MNYKVVLASFWICSLYPVVRFEKIENRTFDGTYKIFLDTTHSVLLSPREKGGFAQYLTTGNKMPIIKIACLQGEYQPIFMQAYENIFTYEGTKRSVKFALWQGSPAADNDEKTFISTYAGSQAVYGLIIHRDGIPEIVCLQDCGFVVPQLPVQRTKPILSIETTKQENSADDSEKSYLLVSHEQSITPHAAVSPEEMIVPLTPHAETSVAHVEKNKLVSTDLAAVTAQKINVMSPERFGVMHPDHGAPQEAGVHPMPAPVTEEPVEVGHLESTGQHSPIPEEPEIAEVPEKHSTEIIK